MMKRNKILSLAIVTSLFVSSLGFSGTVYAKDVVTSVNLLTEASPKEADDFALSEFPKQLEAIASDPGSYGFDAAQLSGLKLGKAFNVYQYKDGNISSIKGYSYPVLFGDKIEGILSVVKNVDGDYTASLSKSFADKLNDLTGDNFALINIKGNIFAVNAKKSILLYKHHSKKNTSEAAPSSSQLQNIDKAVKKEAPKSVNVKAPTAVSNNLSAKAAVSKKILPVSIVLQGQHPWCWAATCAALINYHKGTSLTAPTVVRYIYGSLVDEGGSMDQINQVYQHWGLNPVEYDNPLTYSNVVSLINSNDPINSLMYYSDGYDTEGHSMSIVGYSGKTYKMIDPNEDYYVSVTATTSGSNVEYNLNGEDFVWTYTVVPE